MIPYLSVYDTYTPSAKEISHKVKGESTVGLPIPEAERDMALDIAARDMARLLPSNVVLVPIPSHKGYATDTLLLAKRIAVLAHCKVSDILKGKDRTSSYLAKREGKVLTDEDYGFYLTETPPTRVVYIDNVISSGSTARAVYNIHLGIFLVYVCLKPKGFAQTSFSRGSFQSRGVLRKGFCL